MLATESAHQVEVDGVPHLVQKMPGTENGWAAHQTNIWGGFIDPNDYLMNVKAIEKYTGCHVVKETILNQGMRTSASVECKH